MKISWFLVATTLHTAVASQFAVLGNQATRCPSGREITSLEDCLTAGYVMGGSLLNGNGARQGDWNFTPCGCFFWGTQRAVHCKSDDTTCIGDNVSNYGVLCQPQAGEPESPIRITGDAMQSTTCSDAPASRANDGDVEGGRNGPPLASVSHTW